MAVWAYKGLDPAGKSVTGSREADTPKTLRQLLRREGVVVTDVTEGRAGKATKAGQGKGLGREVDFGRMFERVGGADVANFTRQLSTLLKAGIPLTEALGAMFDQIENEKLRSIVGEVRRNVNEGSSLADAIGKHRTVFSDIYISMVRSGETAGNLDDVLIRLAEFQENQARLKSKVMAALIYPVVMLVVGGVIMAVLMIAVVPKVTSMFEDQGKALPWNTELLIFISDALSNWWLLWLLGIPLVVWAFFKWKRSPKGKPIWDRFVLRLPVVGTLIRQIAVARFSRTLGTMLASGVTLLRALDISKDILNNHLLTKVISEARDEIQQGESIAATLKRSGQFPPVVIHMIAVGERSGQLEQMLGNVADSYETEIDMKVGQLTSLMEPVMILAMGGSVAFVVFSILMPIMQMNDFVQ